MVVGWSVSLAGTGGAGGIAGGGVCVGVAMGIGAVTVIAGCGIDGVGEISAENGELGAGVRVEAGAACVGVGVKAGAACAGAGVRLASGGAGGLSIAVVRSVAGVDVGAATTVMRGGRGAGWSTHAVASADARMMMARARVDAPNFILRLSHVGLANARAMGCWLKRDR